MKYQEPRTDLRFHVIVGIYGENQRYYDLAMKRAIPSAKAATGDVDHVMFAKHDTLQLARNLPAEKLKGETDWLIFLDADDELDPAYIEAMQRKVASLPPGDFVIQPATLGVVDGVEDPEPVLIPAKPSLWDGNHCVIGSAVPLELFLRVDGFDNWPAWEDWGLWLKCLKAGAQFTSCPEAIYRVHIDTEAKSRNQIDPKVARDLFQRMRAHYQRWEVPA